MKRILSVLSVLLVSVSAASAWFEHTIVDVTNGKEIRWITTPETANGYALTQFAEWKFSLNAELFELSDPIWDDFYEWWLVRRDPFDFISTWVIIKDGDIYRDTFTSSEDYSEYDFYVVTLEPNDGNPAPADHIIEGEVILQDVSDDTMMSIQTVDEQEQEILSSREKLIRSAITEKLATLDIDSSLLLERVMNFRDSLENRGLSTSKKAAYTELLDILIEVLKEKIMMQK